MKPPVLFIPLSAIYGAATRTRLTAYRRGWFSVSRLAAPVISVGNLTAGGTGKTPLVEWVCRAIAKAEARDDTGDRKRICVLTRGYGRDNPKTQVVVSNGTELLAGEREAGDEPFLLARKLLGTAAVIANGNRAAAGEWAIEKLKTEVFVLDDGFQHLRLARDLDVVIVDATNPWGGGSLLPYGHLREPRAGLSRADCVVITRADQVEGLASIRATVARLVGAAPVFTSHMVTSGVSKLNGQSVDKESVFSQRLGAFCGVGNPESFFNHLRREGYQLAFTRSFPDHHQYQQSEVDTLVADATASGAKRLITTAKDAIKLQLFKFGIPCFVMDIQISIDEEEPLVELIRKAISNSSRRRSF